VAIEYLKYLKNVNQGEIGGGSEVRPMSWDVLWSRTFDTPTVDALLDVCVVAERLVKDFCSRDRVPAHIDDLVAALINLRDHGNIGAA
jgi:hypothetical protein